MTPAQLSIQFFLQMAVIIGACRAVGWLVQRYFGQPQVIGEMIAGVMLGPSLFGAVAPQWQAMLFPKESQPILFVGAQLGVGLYMFLVGMGFSRDDFRLNARGAAAVSIAGMVVPFMLAVLLAPWLMQQPGLFMPKVDRFEATLFLGAAIAITAFPMLARIIHERGLSGTALGTLSLSAGAIDDVAAWCLIAIVLASLGAGITVAVLAIGGGAAFALVMLLLAPRLIDRAVRRWFTSGGDSSLAFVLLLFLLCAFAMDAVGIHAVFGGFLLGTAMPRNEFTQSIRARLEPFTVVFLLPMFFTYSGLHTQLQTVNSVGLAVTALVLLLASVLAKAGACYVAARLTGQPHDVSLAIGALMNARGLMELIVLNIGLQRGVIGVPFFSVMVVMAVATTLMATPLFEWAYGRKARASGGFGKL